MAEAVDKAVDECVHNELGCVLEWRVGQLSVNGLGVDTSWHIMLPCHTGVCLGVSCYSSVTAQ